MLPSSPGGAGAEAGAGAGSGALLSVLLLLHNCLFSLLRTGASDGGAVLLFFIHTFAHIC